jgi:hypothetical protein
MVVRRTYMRAKVLVLVRTREAGVMFRMSLPEGVKWMGSKSCIVDPLRTWEARRMSR